MAEHSDIEWTDATWNPITGCRVKNRSCKFCYAMKLAGGRLRNHPSRYGLTRKNSAGKSVWTGEVRFNEGWLEQPLRWTRPRMIFVVAHGDLFYQKVPTEWIDRVFDVMIRAQQHTFQVLTKRPERMREWAESATVRCHVCQGEGCNYCGDGNGRRSWRSSPAPNVWLGTSAGDQDEADEHLPELLATPAAVRFASLEPLHGPIDLTRIVRETEHGAYVDDVLAGFRSNGYGGSHGPKLDKIIVGGESGGRDVAKTDPRWVRAIRDQCAAAGKLGDFHFKQWGAYAPVYADPPDEPGTHELRRFPNEGSEAQRDARSIPVMTYVGKKNAGRLLDGKIHDWT